MKKFFLAICIYIVITAFVAVCLNAANPGDIAGRIYSSDILAKIGGHPVPSYNIGGRTVIVLEDLADYLIFDYDFIRWNEDLRILAVSLENPHGAHQRFVARHAVGGVPIGNIYHTDIRVYINGRPIPAYSLNGRMAVAIEDIGGVASGEVWSPFYAVYNWREDTRTIYLDFIPGDNLWDIADIVGERPLYLAIFGNQIHFGFDHFRPGFGVSSQFAPARGITPLYHNGRAVGFLHTRECDIDNFVTNTHLYLDIIREIVYNIEIVPPTFEQTLHYFVYEKFGSIITRQDNEYYTFLHIFQGGLPGGHSNNIFVRINRDGSWVISPESD